jgi:hypothetical protein
VSGAGADAPDVRAWSIVSAGGRLGFGVAMLVAPETALRALGFGEVTPATKAVARIAGVRDFVLGSVTLGSLDDRDRLRTATVANATADAGDSLAFGVALNSSERAAGVRGMAFALPAALIGAWTAWRLS